MTVGDRAKGVDGSAVVAALATVVFVVVWVRFSDARAVASLVFVVVLGVLAARSLVRGVVSATGTGTIRNPGVRPFDLAFRPPAPRSLEKLSERRQIAFELRSSQDVASTLHFQLRPRLRVIADDRLAAGHGLSLDRDPEASRRLLGEEAWELLRADRPQPTARSGAGIPAAELERIISEVEGL